MREAIEVLRQLHELFPTSSLCQDPKCDRCAAARKALQRANILLGKDLVKITAS